MPASTQVQGNHTVHGGRTEAFVSICERFNFQLQSRFFFFLISLEVPTLQQLQDFFTN